MCNVPVKQKFKVPFGTRILTLLSRQFDSIKAFKFKGCPAMRCLERPTVNMLITLGRASVYFAFDTVTMWGQHKYLCPISFLTFPQKAVDYNFLSIVAPVPFLQCGQRPRKRILSHFGGKTLHTHKIPGTPRQCSQCFTSIYSTTFLLITMGCFNYEQQKCEFSVNMEHDTAEWGCIWLASYRVSYANTS